MHPLQCPGLDPDPADDVRPTGFEPVTSALSRRRSKPTELRALLYFLGSSYLSTTSHPTSSIISNHPLSKWSANLRYFYIISYDPTEDFFHGNLTQHRLEEASSYKPQAASHDMNEVNGER